MIHLHAWHGWVAGITAASVAAYHLGERLRQFRDRFRRRVTLRHWADQGQVERPGSIEHVTHLAKRDAERNTNRLVQAIRDLSTEVAQTRSKLSGNTHSVFRDRLGWWHMLPMADIGYRRTDTGLLFAVVGGRDHAQVDTDCPTGTCMPADFDAAVQRCLEVRESHLAEMEAKSRNLFALHGRHALGVTYQEYARMSPRDQERVVNAGRDTLAAKSAPPKPESKR